MQNFLPTTNTTPGYLALNYLTPGPSPGFNEIRNDKAVAFAICPVQQNIAGEPNPFIPDYESGDAFSMALGNFDEPPTAGVFSLQVGATTTGLADLAYNISAAALQTALNVALAAESESLCTVLLAASGAYIITGATNGAITDGFFAVLSDSGLYPISNAFFTKGSNGSASTPYRYTLTLRQAPMCYAEPTVELPAADVDVEDIQDTGVGQSVIRRVHFTVDEVTAGSFTLNATANGVTATCGTVTPLMSAREFGLILAQHPEINYATPDAIDNVSVTISGQSWLVTAIGDLFDDATFDLVATNNTDNPLVGPAGLSGSINYNTFGLYVYSLSQADTFTLTRQIQRTRGGETRTLYSGEVTIYKELIDASTAVPTPTIAYYTAVQSDARFLKKITPGDALPSGYTLEVESGADVDFQAGSDLNIDGTLNGTPTGGSLDLSAVTLTLPGGGDSLVDVQVFTADGTWTKPANALYCEILMIGGGGGGGSGRAGTNASAKGGGGGGGGGAIVMLTKRAASLSATEAVVVGLGGDGGAAVTNSNGNPGTVGTNSTFVDLIAKGGNFGAGGTTSGGAAGATLTASCTNGFVLLSSLAGGAGGTAAGSAGVSSGGLTLPTGGGGGGGGNNTTAAGGSGGNYGGQFISASAFAAGGTAGGGNGTPGFSETIHGLGGGGGGTGDTAGTIAGGTGGDGGLYGGGGGGGGAGVTTIGSGAGGNGGDGVVIIVTKLAP